MTGQTNTLEPFLQSPNGDFPTIKTEAGGVCGPVERPISCRDNRSVITNMGIHPQYLPCFDSM